MTKISLDIVNFKQEMQRIKKEVQYLANEKIEDQINYAEQTLKIVTPVDTGKARSGWTSKTNKDFNGYTEGIISNDVEYIDVLNKGHSKQAPKYFIEQVLMTIGILTPN